MACGWGHASSIGASTGVRTARTKPNRRSVGLTAAVPPKHRLTRRISHKLGVAASYLAHVPAKPFGKPRDWLATPNDFGKAENPVWRNTRDPQELLRLHVARRQHKIARRLRYLIDSQSGGSKKTVTQICKEIGIDRDFYYDTLNGSRQAEFAILEAIAFTLGYTLKIDLERIRPGQPPGAIDVPLNGRAE